ncbi:hypothetical protein ACOJBM_43355 [Rhizobium beringeri]
MQTDYAGHTIPIIDPSTGVIHSAQILCGDASRSHRTFLVEAFSQNCSD